MNKYQFMETIDNLADEYFEAMVQARKDYVSKLNFVVENIDFEQISETDVTITIGMVLGRLQLRLEEMMEQ